MGIKIAAGTDDGYNANSHRVSDEVAELVLSGMPPMEAIKAATSVSPNASRLRNESVPSSREGGGFHCG